MPEYIKLTNGLVVVEITNGVLVGHIGKWLTLPNVEARAVIRKIVDWVEVKEITHSCDFVSSENIQLINSLDEMGFIERKSQEQIQVEFLISHFNEVGALLAAILMHHGIPVKVLSDRSARFSDIHGLYLRMSDVGFSISELLLAQNRELINSGKATKPLHGEECRDSARRKIVVITTYPEPELLARLMEEGIEYLCTLTTPFGALVGPFVTPGKTPCFHCVELHRSERDGDWQKVAMAFFLQRNERIAPDCASFTAAIVGHLLVRIARGEIPHEVIASTGMYARLDPHNEQMWRASAGIKRESRMWNFHPECSCHWGRALSTRAD